MGRTPVDKMALPLTLITLQWTSFKLPGRRPLPTSPRVVCTIHWQPALLHVRTDEMAWVDSALRRLYSTRKACDRNRTLPYWYRDFDCVQMWPKYSVFDYDSMINSTLLYKTSFPHVCQLNIFMICYWLVKFNFKLTVRYSITAEDILLITHYVSKSQQNI